MSKNSAKFKRALALLLSFAMVVSVLTVAPATTSEAAAKKIVKKLSVSGKVTLNAGQSKTVNAKVTANKKKVYGKNDLRVTVKSSDKNVATAKVTNPKASKKKISSATSKIKITAKDVTKKSTAKITVTAKSKSTKGKAVKKTITVMVNPIQQPTTEPTTQPTQPAVIAVNSVYVTAPKTSLSVGEITQLATTVYPDNATDKTVTYASNNNSVATVSETGLVTAKAAGTARITATAGGKSGYVDITVNTVSVTGIHLDTKNLTLEKGSTSQLTYKITPIEATNQNVTWTSNNTGVSTVSNTGVVTAVSVGTAKITVRTEDGGYTDDLTVNVTDSSIGLSDKPVLNVPSALKEYSEPEKGRYVVLTGTTPSVTVQFAQNGQALGQKDVKLQLTPIDGTGNLDNMYTVAHGGIVKTDDNGIATFTLDYGNETLKPTDGKFQSYQMKATLVGSGIGTDSETTITQTISFACIDVLPPNVVNGYTDWFNYYYDNIFAEDMKDVQGLEPRVNSPISIAEVESANGDYEVEYITSQQASSAEKDHRITMVAMPFLKIPATSQDKEAGFYKDDINFESGSYSLYNDETNKTTTCTIETIPAGIEYATIVFNKIDISKYAKILITVYDKNTNKPLGDPMEFTNISTSSPSRLQISCQEDRECYAVISIISEGQIDAAHTQCYMVGHIEGNYATGHAQVGKYVALNDKVTWEIDKDFVRTGSITELTYEQAKAYISSKDNPYDLKPSYKYKVSVPTFPYVGNALIYVMKNDEEVVSYYTYPIENNSNTNVLAPSGEYGYAVRVTTAEATKMVQGEMSQKNGFVTVDSREVGYTPLKVTIDLKSSFGIEGYMSEMRSFIQWSNVPYGDSNAITDYYALTGQKVEVFAQLLDANNLPANDSQKTITLEAANGDYELAEFIDNASEKGTNSDGIQKFILKNPDGDTKFLNQLKASAPGYKVQLKVGGSQKALNVSDKDCANIIWVDAGLYFKDAADGTSDVSFETGKKFDSGNTNNMTHEVDTEWIVGFKVVGRLPDGFDTEREITKIDGIPVTGSYTGKGTCRETDETGVFKLRSYTSGTESFKGEINAGNPGKVIFHVADENGDVKTEESIGIGTPTNHASIELEFKWTNTSDISGTIITPLGNSIYKTVNTVAYIKIVDGGGHAIEGREVDYTLTYADSMNMEPVNGSATTDENGLIHINLPAPNKAGQVTISGNVEATSIETSTIVYREDASEPAPFTITDASLNSAGNQPTVTVKFSNALDKGTLDIKAFKLTSDDMEFNITNVEFLSSDDTVKITLASGSNIAEATAVVLKVGSYAKDGIGGYQILDTYKQTIAGDSNTCPVTKQ